jgi:regulator of protease activity HflC (stomatin/prohibitin superfamily)
MLVQAVVGAVFLILVALSVRIVAESERLGVMRLGRVVGMRGPGIVVVIPGVDKAVRIDLPKDIPSWRSLPTDVLEREVERLTQAGGLRM